MREDQYRRLVALQERLIDEVLREADPEQWPGAGIAPGALDRDTRGDRFWCKRNAVATLSIEARIASRISFEQRRAPGAPEVPEEALAAVEDDLDAEIGKFEKEAARHIAKFRAGARGGS